LLIITKLTIKCLFNR